MSDPLFRDKSFSKLMIKHCSDLITMLFFKNESFSVVVKSKFIECDPPLPEHLDFSKNPYVLLAIEGYSFATLEVRGQWMVFHASFGTEDFMSWVGVPFGAISQVQREGNVIFLNLADFTPPPKIQLSQDDERYPEDEEEEEIAKMQRSMKLFLSNPKNKPKK